METWTELDTVLDLVWRQVEAGATNPEHPFRTPAFATSGGEQPQVRTVVLRAARRDTREVSFHTDRRTGKVGEIRANERIAWHAWDPGQSLQIRLRGHASVHSTDAIADRMWQSEPPENLGHYLKENAPATPIGAPRDGLPTDLDQEELTSEDVAAGRSNFAVIRTVIDEIDALHLQRKNHQRAIFRWNESEKTFDADWLVP